LLEILQQAARKEAVMEAYLAAQKYCAGVDCRRSTLLKYFGEMTTSNNCGEYFVMCYQWDAHFLNLGNLCILIPRLLLQETATFA